MALLPPSSLFARGYSASTRDSGVGVGSCGSRWPSCASVLSFPRRLGGRARLVHGALRVGRGLGLVSVGAGLRLRLRAGSSAGAESECIC
eukprot:scaffold236789_cov31-Tisochrysis_lutea.AAC.1